MTKPRLLCIDDEADILESLQRLLKNDWELTMTHDAVQAMEHLTQENNIYDVILTDYRMPYHTGLDIFKQARAHQPLCTRCLLTGQMDLQAAANGINNGLIHKLILKPWDNEHLKLQLDEARELHQILKERSLDSMTGLPNHRYFQEYSAQLFEDAEKKFCMVIFDVDHFKSYNDQYGHVVGDKLLIAVARVLRESLDPKYFLARYGGEEFIALLPRADLDTAYDVAEIARKALEKENFIGVLPRASFVNISAGVSEYPIHGNALKELMESADKALYAAKNDGRNQTKKAGSVEPS